MNAVQIYKEDDLMEVAMDQDKIDAWKEATARLGLEKQAKFVDGVKSPIPFMVANERTMNVVKTLCPRESLVEHFDHSPIPLEVLKTIDFCRHENYFSKMYVYFDDKTPDPFLVGVIEEPIVGWWKGAPEELRGKSLSAIGPEHKIDEKWIEQRVVSRYLIAKWGDVKKSMSELAKMAKERYIVERSSTLKKDIRRLNSELECLEEDAVEKFPL